MALVSEDIRDTLDSRDVDRLVALVFDESVEDEERPTAVRRALWELEGLGYPELASLSVQASVELPEDVCREVRQYFLDQWVERDGYDQRPEVLRLLAERLDGSDSDHLVRAIRAVQFIGYREDALVERLERFSGIVGSGREKDDVEAWALTALARMSYPEPERITQRLEHRLEKNGELNEADCWTALYHASEEMLPALFVAISWNKPALSAIANLVEREPKLAPEAWRLFLQGDDAEYWISQGRMAEAIDRPEVGAKLVDDAVEALRDHESMNTLVPMNRLINATNEQVIEGARVRGATLTEEELGWIRKPATLLDPLNLRVMTSEGYDKDAAWKVLLHLARPEARAWLADAVGTDPSFADITYVQYAGYLQEPSVVPVLAQVIRDKDTDLGHGLRIIEALGTIGTEDALRALLDSEVWLDEKDEGGIPRDLVGAMVSASITLRSDAVVWEALTDPKRHDAVRIACAYVIQELSQYPNAPAPRISEIHALLAGGREHQPGWKQLLTVRGEFDTHPETLGLLDRIAKEEPQDNAITEALARSGVLANYPERLERLGLARRDGKWQLLRDLDRHGSFILLLLYKSDRQFEGVVIEFLDKASYSTASNILYNLHRGEQVSPALAEALFNRLVEGKGGLFSGGGTVHALGNVAPDFLIRRRLLDVVEGWNSKNIAEYLGQLRESHEAIQGRDELVSVGLRFLQDEDTDVRREAARLLRSVSPLSLDEALTQTISKAERLDQWVYAIQAARYLDQVPKQWKDVCGNHPEPQVRAALRQTVQEVERAVLARKYTKRVLEQEDVLQAWAYGNALLQIGDEESAERLLDGLPEPVYRRAYLIDLSKKVKKSAEERRKKLDDDVVLPPLSSQKSSVLVYFNGLSNQPYKATLIERGKSRSRKHVPSSWRLEFEDVPRPIAEHEEMPRFHIKVEDEQGETAQAVIRRGSKVGGDKYVVVSHGLFD